MWAVAGTHTTSVVWPQQSVAPGKLYSKVGRGHGLGTAEVAVVPAVEAVLPAHSGTPCKCSQLGLGVSVPSSGPELSSPACKPPLSWSGSVHAIALQWSCGRIRPRLLANCGASHDLGHSLACGRIAMTLALSFHGPSLVAFPVTGTHVTGFRPHPLPPRS